MDLDDQATIQQVVDKVGTEDLVVLLGSPNPESAELYAATGAVLIGRRMFDAGFEPWGDPPPFGRPVFVLTHETRDPLPMQGSTTYHFVTDGIEAGLEQARAAAGGKDVSIWGGANVLRQYLRAGLLDEMEIHLIPVLVGDGIRLFQDLGLEQIELRRTRCLQTPGATHLRFEVVKGSLELNRRR